MPSDFWAAIIAALIGAVGTLIATRLDDIVVLFQKKTRDISGDWQVESHKADDASWVGDYDLKLKQHGTKITGEMRATKVKEGFPLYNYAWSGDLHGEYLIYKCIGDEPQAFLISCGILRPDATGRSMAGHFIANAGAGKPTATWVGTTTLKRKS